MTDDLWRYRQRLRGQLPQDYRGDVTYIGGDAGRRLARDLATVSAQLLSWARDADEPAPHDLNDDLDFDEAA